MTTQITVKRGETHVLEAMLGLPEIIADSKKQEGFARACRASQFKRLESINISSKNSLISAETEELLKNKAKELLKPITDPHKWIEQDLTKKALEIALQNWLNELKIISLYI